MNLTTAGIVAIVATLGLVLTFVAWQRSQRALRRSAAQFRGMMDATGFGVLIVQRDGLISYANTSAEEMLGYSSHQLVGQEKHTLLHGNGVDPGECLLSQALMDHERYFGHEYFIDARRNLVPVTVSSAPLPDGEGSAMVFRDRSTEVAQARAQEQAFALISHEIRSPLTTVVGFSSRLSRAVAAGRLQIPDQYAEEIDLLSKEAARMRDIVTVILDVATLERRIEIQPEPIILRRLTAEEADRLGGERPGVNFVCDEADLDGAVVESDDRYVRRIVQNLLENAAKYAADAGPIEVTVRATGDGAEVCVRDHGPGIPSDVQARVFERFYRQETGAGARPGLGLGLFLSKQLALRLGGHLSLRSEPGRGAEFTLWLPSEPPEVPVEPQATADIRW
ncbi:MAG: ATP-binding protein [Dehalococcoidia bacterium]|nr:ATP-binding protein [Dehalococcoidia bacterium]